MSRRIELVSFLVVNTLETNNFEVFVQHMSEVVTDVPRRLLRSVSVYFVSNR